MKIIFKTAIFFLMICIAISASESKRIKKSFKVDPGQRIEIQSISGMDVRVKTWDKNEVSIDLLVKVKSSDKDFEKEYIEELDVFEMRSASDLIIEFVETDEGGGWSFWEIFKLKFHYYFTKDINGEIFVPKNNSLETDFRYSKIQLEDMIGEFNLYGRANDVVLKNCTNVQEIDNDYGDVTIENCGGSLNLESRSSEIKVKSFEGNVKIFANYANVTLLDITQNVVLKSRSANHRIENIGGDVIVNSDYSEVSINNVNGFVEIVDRSEDVEIKNVGGLKAEGPYTNFKIENIKGTAGEEIVISNKSGEIIIKKAVGNLFITDSYSNMDFSDIQGNVKLTSRSSSITGDKIKGDWFSDTKYCRITLKDIETNDLSIENRSDPVNINFINVPSRVEIINEYGDVEVYIPKGFEGNISLSAKHGSVESTVPLKYDSKGSTVNATDQIGTGNGIIKIETKSADIKLNERAL